MCQSRLSVKTADTSLPLNTQTNIDVYSPNEITTPEKV